MEYPKRTSILAIKELIVTNQEPADLFRTENITRLSVCPDCGAVGRLSVERPKPRELKDVLLYHDKSIVDLEYNYIRYRCAECTRKNGKNKNILVPILFAEKNSRYTCRLARHIFILCQTRDTINDVLKELDGKMSRDEVLGAFEQLYRQLDKRQGAGWAQARRIGIHRLRVRGLEFYCVSNLDRMTLIDLYPDFSSDSQKSLSKKLKNPVKVQEVWIDGNDTILNYAVSAFPNAEVKIGIWEAERFLADHLIQMTRNQSFTIRNSILKEKLSAPTRRELTEYLKAEPFISDVYDARCSLLKHPWKWIKPLFEPWEKDPSFCSNEEFEFKDTVKNIYPYLVEDADISCSTGYSSFEEYHRKIQEIESILRYTRKCSFPVMRARTVYSEAVLDYRQDMDLLLEMAPAGKTENEAFTDSVIRDCTAFLRPGSRTKVGQPLSEVVMRLELIMATVRDH